MYFDECITKKSKMPLYTLSAFSILIVVSMALALNVNVDKSFAERVPLLPINSTDPQLNEDMAKFYSCIEDTVENSQSDEEPHYFKDEPTKTEVALCYNEEVANKN
jgi:hypothetical protein